MAMVTDVTRREDIKRAVDAVLGRFGHIDVWVNNAGRGITKPALELTDDELDQMMTVNVKSALYGMQAIVPHFIQRGRGQIVNVSSFLSRVPFATFRYLNSIFWILCLLPGKSITWKRSLPLK